MLTVNDLICAVLIPAIVAAVIAALGRWRRWGWAMPAAAGIGFLTGYVLSVGIPALPPQDGTDWLFWAGIVLTIAGILDALTASRWGWLFGVLAGGVAFVIGKPLVPASVSLGSLVGIAIGAALLGAAVCWAVQWAQSRSGARPCIGGLCVVMGGAAIVVLSSNLRIVGVYGLAAAASLGAVAVLSLNHRIESARSVSIVAAGILAGLLSGGHFYPDPGVSLTHAAVLMAVPLVLLPAGLIPTRRRWVKGGIGFIVICIIIGIITGPIAIKAKRAAETDPYGGGSSTSE